METSVEKMTLVHQFVIRLPRARKFQFSYDASLTSSSPDDRRTAPSSILRTFQLLIETGTIHQEFFQ